MEIVIIFQKRNLNQLKKTQIRIKKKLLISAPFHFIDDLKKDLIKKFDCTFVNDRSKKYINSFKK